VHPNFSGVDQQAFQCKNLRGSSPNKRNFHSLNVISTCKTNIGWNLKLGGNVCHRNHTKYSMEHVMKYSTPAMLSAGLQR